MKTIASPYLLNFFETCIAQGANERELLALIPGGKKALNTLRMRFPVECLINILAHTERATNTPEIGLLAAKKILPSSFIDIGNAIMFCETLRQAILLNCHYQAITQQVGRVELDVQQEKTLLYWHTGPSDPENYRHITDAVMAYHVQFARWLDWSSNSETDIVHFRHKKPTYAHLYEEIFECPVLFSQPGDVMVSDAATLDTPRPQANASMLANICVRLDTVLQAVEGNITFTSRVEHHIRTAIAQRTPSLASTALILNISERSLRRRLKEEETSFRAVLEKTRKDLCDYYMVERKLPFSKISDKLGYSEQSAFNRAFKSWYGQPPKRYAAAMNILDQAFDQLAP